MTVSISFAGRVAVQTELHGRQVGLGPATTAAQKQGGQALIVRGEASSVNFTATPSTTNICIVGIQLADNEGKAIGGISEIKVFLSDSASGIGLTATTASGAVANDGTHGTDLVALVAKKLIEVQTDANGIYNLSITDSAKTAFFVAVQIGRHLGPRVSAALITANFG